MKHKRVVWIASISFIMILFLIIGLKWWTSSSSAQTLTEGEAKKIAIEKYSGEIVQTLKTDDTFQIEMKRDKGIYHLAIDAKSGEVISLELIEKRQEEQPESEQQPKQLTENEIKVLLASQGVLQSLELITDSSKPYYEAVVNKNNEEVALKVDAITGEVVESKNKRATIITEHEAAVIARKEVKGTVDDVDLHDSSDGTPYYLVEIEPEDGEDMVVLVDAYTGEVKSVTLEDNVDDLD